MASDWSISLVRDEPDRQPEQRVDGLALDVEGGDAGRRADRDLLRRVPREVLQQRRLAGAGAAGDEDVLARVLDEPEQRLLLGGESGRVSPIHVNERMPRPGRRRPRAVDRSSAMTPSVISQERVPRLGRWTRGGETIPRRSRPPRRSPSAPADRPSTAGIPVGGAGSASISPCSRSSACCSWRRSVPRAAADLPRVLQPDRVRRALPRPARAGARRRCAGRHRCGRRLRRARGRGTSGDGIRGAAATRRAGHADRHRGRVRGDDRRRHDARDRRVQRGGLPGHDDVRSASATDGWASRRRGAFATSPLARRWTWR